MFTQNIQVITAIAALIATLATVAYLGFTIGIFLQTKKSADAAAEAARATTTSTNILSQLHRPYMGLSGTQFFSEHQLSDSFNGERSWMIQWSFRNFGSVPANHVHASLECEIEFSKLRIEHMDPLGDTEAFPGSEPLHRRSMLFVNFIPRVKVARHESLMFVTITIQYADLGDGQYRNVTRLRFEPSEQKFHTIESRTDVLAEPVNQVNISRLDRTG